MEISISIEPYLNGSKEKLRQYLDDITALKKYLPVSVHYDCFTYQPDILKLVGAYTDKIAVHLHSMLANIDKVIGEISKYNFASVSVHSDNQYIVYLMNIGITTYSKGIVIDLSFTDIDGVADIIKKCEYATVMTVMSGGSGRPFDKSALGKIDKIRAINPDIKIIIDGGVNENTVNFVKEKSAEIAVAGSYAQKCYEAGNLRNGLIKLLL
jgi:pentose-5-phosphate-3-epimerase